MLNGSPIDWPTLTLGGVTYTVRFTRGALLFKLSESGTTFADMSGAKAFASLVKGLHAGISPEFPGTPEQLADVLVNEGKVSEAKQAFDAALKKAFPTPPTKAAEAAEQPASPLPQ